MTHELKLVRRSQSIARSIDSHVLSALVTTLFLIFTAPPAQAQSPDPLKVSPSEILLRGTWTVCYGSLDADDFWLAVRPETNPALTGSVLGVRLNESYSRTIDFGDAGGFIAFRED